MFEQKPQNPLNKTGNPAYDKFDYTDLTKEKPERHLSMETRKKISAARRARKKQPREGTSKKSQTFYSELMKEYKNDPKAVAWIKKHEEQLNNKEKTKEMGICTEYDEMYNSFYALSLGTIFFGESITHNNDLGEYSEFDNVTFDDIEHFEENEEYVEQYEEI